MVGNTQKTDHFMVGNTQKMDHFIVGNTQKTDHFMVGNMLKEEFVVCGVNFWTSETHRGVDNPKYNEKGRGEAWSRERKDAK